MICRLCFAKAEEFFNISGKRYHRCRQCLAVFLAPGCQLSKNDEKRRYQEHNNNVEDPGYQKFVEPIVSKVQKNFTKKQRGLDFGAGTGPVITKLLSDKGYHLKLYDPYFWNYPDNLKEKYDFIVCCEVIEHFRNPAKWFKLLKSLLKPGGGLYCMTDLYSDMVNFRKWYYKDDPTHVFFYHQKTLAWIKSQIGFSSLKVDGRLIQFLL
jgi:SAM-dependent methyltransferase